MWTIRDLYDNNPEMMFVAGSLLSIEHIKNILKLGLVDFNIKTLEEYKTISNRKKEKLFSYLYDMFDFSMLNPDVRNFSNMTLNEFFICNAIDRLYNEGKCTISPEQIIDSISFFNKQKDKNELINYIINVVEKYSNIKYLDKRKDKKDNFVHKYFHCIQTEFIVNGNKQIMFTILMDKFNTEVAAI